jgi:hypothetical protein
MAGGEQLPDDRRTDESGRAGDEDAHEKPPSWDEGTIDVPVIRVK